MEELPWVLTELVNNAVLHSGDTIEIQILALAGETVTELPRQSGQPQDPQCRGLDKRGFDGLHLVRLVLDEAFEDLLKGALPVAESEAAVGRDGVELVIG